MLIRTFPHNLIGVTVFFLLAITYSTVVFAQDIETFAFGLGLELRQTTINQLKNYDLVVIDGTEATAQQVSDIQSQGAIVLGYASAGTIESGRPWSKKLKKKYSLGYWEEWDEWYADVAKRKFRRFFKKKIISPILNKGFHGLFLDNTDMIESFPKKSKGMKKLLKMTRKVLGTDRLLFIQNGDEIMYKLEEYIDGWNREDVTSYYDFDSESYVLQNSDDITSTLQFIQSMIAKGFIVSTADYTLEQNSMEASQSIANSCSTGATPFVSDILLTRLPESPIRCGS